MLKVLLHGTSAIAVILVASGCANTAQQQAGTLHVVEPGDNTMSCDNLKTSIAQVDNTITQLQNTQRDQVMGNAMADTASTNAVSSAYAGPQSEIFGPLQTALASVSSAQRQHDTTKLAENLASAKGRRDHLTNIHNQRCSQNKPA
jgi:hypothetical protein